MVWLVDQPEESITNRITAILTDVIRDGRSAHSTETFAGLAQW
jgi:hypothetical protein